MGSANPRPPRLALLLLRLALRGEARDVVVGDLLEEFEERVQEPGGVREARRWFWRQTLGSVYAAGSLGMGSVSQDLRFAVRALARRPGFAIVASLTLAVGVGSTTAVFGFANWVLLRPLPGVSVPGDRLATLEFRQSPSRGSGVSYANLLDLEAGATAVDRLVAGTQGEQLR